MAMQTHALSPPLPRVIVTAMLSRRSLPLACLVAGVVACGSRTGLPVTTENDGGAALSPVRVTPPPPGAADDCAEAGATQIYVVTLQSALLSFYPPTNTFTPIGSLACPVAINADSRPFSMAVDRTGVAYVVYDDGELFRVSTATAACHPTGFVPNPRFGPSFGMAFAHDPAGGADTLYVADGASPCIPARLAHIDTQTFALTLVGTVSPVICAPELTASGTGDLFAFYPIHNDSAIGQIDRVTARVIGQSVLKGVARGQDWAFALWGGDFYAFTERASQSIVTRFRPTDGSIVQVAQLSDLVVGAGVSTCAPPQ
jgi:hypothetical protein